MSPFNCAILLTFWVCSSGICGPVESPIRFNTFPRDFSTGGPNGNAAFGDFNGDGELDAVTAGGSVPNSIALLLGDGHGQFRQPVFTFLGGTVPLFVLAVDVNQDGKLDVVIATTTGVSTLLGNGDGTFQPPVVSTLGPIYQIAAGDFNGDGFPDLAANETVYLGDGRGAFLATGQRSVNALVAVADINHDGNLDVITGNSVLYGNGDGTLQPPVVFYTGVVDPNSVAVGDLNHDGLDDIVVSGSESFDMTVLLGESGGGFAQPVLYALTGFGSGVAIGDLNGDGNADIVVTFSPYFTDTNGLSAFLGKGDGTFSSGINYPVGVGPVFPVMEDFNRDGHLDVATSNGDWTISILLGNGKGGFRSSPEYAIGALVQPASIAAADFNQDGNIDLVTADPASNSITFLFGNGQGAFGAPHPVAFSADTAPSAVVAADLNSDGKADLVIAESTANSIAILTATGNGAFQPPVIYPVGENPAAIVAVDLNHDGKPDLIAVNEGSDTVSVLLAGKGGTFEAPVNYYVQAAPSGIALADFNRDGNVDLAVLNGGSHSVSVLLGKGDGTFGLAVTYTVPEYGLNLSSVTTGDFNGDGIPDLAVSGVDSETLGSAICLLPGKAGGGFQNPSCTFYGGQFYSLTAADLNGDGKPDLAVIDQLSNSVLVLENAGDHFNPPVYYGTGFTPAALAVADFNSDGKPDVAVAANSFVTVLNSGGH